jgi:dolichol-phosphate mannosyltransferase
MPSADKCLEHCCGVPGVPAYDIVATLPRQSDFCAVVFVLNEDGKVQKQLLKMKAYEASVDIVIADGGSTDHAIQPHLLDEYGVNTILVKKGPGALGSQMRMAFSWAIRRGYRGVITMDGNNKDGPEALPRFVESLREGYDHVQGSRFIPGGQSENLPWSRWLGLKLIHIPMIARASGFRYTDTTNGFRAYSRRFLTADETGVFRDVFVGYELHYYLAVRAARRGFNVVEVPVARRYPTSGRVPTKISPIRGNLRVLRSLVSACLGQYDP